jgi:hypothetical protein
MTVSSPEPTPTSDVVRSPRPVVSTAVTFVLPWNVTRIPPENRYSTNGPKSFLDVRILIGLPSAARTWSRVAPSRAPAIPASTWIRACAEGAKISNAAVIQIGARRA